MKTTVYKFTSLVIVLSLLLTLFATFPKAEGSAEESGVKVIYNRGFEDGWNYDNGLLTDAKHELDANLTYIKMSPTWYDYFLRLAPTGDRGGYLRIPMGESTPESGKLFLELDIKSETKDNNIGGVIMTAGVGESPLFTHIVSFDEGRLRIFGEDVGSIPTSWATLSFEFDFDYAQKTPGAAADEYLATAKLDGTAVASRIYTARSFGFSSIYIGAQENFLGFDRAGDSYLVDNIKVYYGADSATELPADNLGTAVDTSAERDFEVLGTSAAAGYLSGSPAVDRLDKADPSIIVHYNRHYGEGWDYDNGFQNARSTMRENEFGIASDYSSEMNPTGGFTNYFLKIVQRNTNNGFIALDGQTAVPRSTGKTFFEFDIKAAPGATIPCLFEIVTPGNSVTYVTDMMHLSGGKLIVFGEDFGQLGEEWCHVIVEMDYDYGPEVLGDPTAIKYTVKVGSEAKTLSVIKYVKADGIDKYNFRGLMQIRIGRLGSAFRDGDWYGLDNVQLYTATAPANIEHDNYGSLVRKDSTKDYPITDGFVDDPLVSQIVEMSLTMKVNSDNALLRGKKVDLFVDENGEGYGAPYKENGVVMIPLEPVLNYIGSPFRYNSDGLACDVYANGEYRSVAVGRDSIMIDGVDYMLSAAPTVRTEGANKVFYIGLEDVEKIFAGYYVTYDEVGFISISPYNDYLNRDTDEDYMREVMRSFVYDTVDIDTMYETVRENTNNFDHPYFYVKQDKFDELYDVYHSIPGSEGYDKELYKYIDDSVKKAEKYYLKYVDLDENGNYAGLKKGQYVYSTGGMASWVTNTEGVTDPYSGKILSSANDHSIAIMPYPENNGYDYAGDRLNILSDGENCLSAASMGVAFGYQMTKDENWLRFVYDWSVALTSWTHWAPAHYLNTAGPAHYIGLAYDWCYDGWVEIGLDPTPILDGLHRLTTHSAWRAVNNLSAEYKALNGGESGKYWNHIGNWNPVCSAGVILSCLLSLENPAYHDEATYTLERTVYYLGYNGFTYFAFDGSYRESAGYWCATIRYSQFCIKELQNAFGTDFGLLDAPGMDISNYFGSHSETADNGRWNYHDDWEGFQPSYWYYMAAEMFDNPDFAAIRYEHVQQGKDMNMLDALFYDKDMIPEDSVTIPLDFVMDSIDATVSRSSWKPGALYAGIMGGINNVAHGQYDSGNWIYENGGVRWFVDLGADDYNLYGGGLSRGYYKYSTQGNNVLCLATEQTLIPHGQTLNGGGEIIYSVTNGYGSATVIDNSSAYGGSEYVTYAKRGMFVTNDRKTVVIQDEVSMVLVQDLYWYAHFDTRRVASCDISDDGRTVIMKSVPDANNQTKTLRVTLVTANRGFKFEVQDTTSKYFVLDATPLEGYSEEMTGGVVKEQDRSRYKKLAICGKNTLKFDVAVVIEMIDPEAPEEVGYTLGWGGNANALPPMEKWMPSADTRGIGDSIVDKAEERPTPALSSIFSNADILSSYITSGAYLGSDREAFFTVLSDTQYAINRFGRNQTSQDILAAIAAFDEAKAKYDKFQGKIDKDTKEAASIAEGLLGIKRPEAAAPAE